MGIRRVRLGGLNNDAYVVSCPVDYIKEYMMP